MVNTFPQDHNGIIANALETTTSITLSIPFEIGKTYTRGEISKLLQSKDSNIRNGVFRPKGRDFIIIFVTENKTKDRTQYKDHLAGDLLLWEGQKSGRTDSDIIRHLEDRKELLLMYRLFRKERLDYSFLYVGRLLYITHRKGSPSNFQFRLLDYGHVPDPMDDREEITWNPIEGPEGKQIMHDVSGYERSRRLRDAALSFWGTSCSICGFNFSTTYGDIGKGYAEVHHVIPLSETKSERITDPTKDLVVVCSNCHSMLHIRKPAMRPEELANVLNK